MLENVLIVTKNTWDRQKDHFVPGSKNIIVIERTKPKFEIFLHLQDCRHSVGSVDEIMEVVQDVSKGTFMNLV